MKIMLENQIRIGQMQRIGVESMVVIHDYSYLVPRI